MVNNQNSEAGNNNSEDNTTDMESAGASRIQSNHIKQTKGVRSLSIQNNSTKVSSFSDATGQNYSDDNSCTNNAVRRAPTNTTKANNGNKEAALTSDIMELISEEELSVCRSEGSPPRKNKKRRKEEAKQQPMVDMNNPTSTAVTKFGQAGGKASNAPKGTAGANGGKKTANPAPAK